MSVEIINFRPQGDHEWTRFAECAKPGRPGMFPKEKDLDGIKLAKATCTDCPVLAMCLNDALRRNEQYGVWGGHTTEERRTIQRNRARQTRRSTARLKAPQKADAAALDTASSELGGAA